MDCLKARLIKHMEYLCLECGSRQCGSLGERKAADYIGKEFQKMGYETVREEFPVVGWDCFSFSLWNVTKNRAVPGATAEYFSNSVDIEDKFVFLKGQDLKRLDSMDLKDKLCFVEIKVVPPSIGGKGLNKLAEILDSYGVKGAVFLSPGPDENPSTKCPRSPFMKKMGVASVSLKGALDIVNNKDDIYKLKIDAKKFDTVAYNVIARLSGGDKKGVIGAHYDTAPFIMGSDDDASGISVMLELAREVKDKYKGWSFDFCAFSAEEYIPCDFPLGSKDYVRKHINENLKWFLNIDGTSMKLTDKILDVTHQDKIPVIELDVSFTREAPLSGDDKTFFHNGIPTVWLRTQETFGLIHTLMDSLENSDYDKMVEYTKDYISIFHQLTFTE